MENFFVESTNKTPLLKFEPNSGVFSIEGRSIPENSIEFYKPLFDWLDDYAQNPSSTTLLEVKLEYFNTSSSKCLVEIFRKLEKMHNSGKTIHIKWFYEEDDEDMLESGEDFREIIDVPISMHVLDEE